MGGDPLQLEQLHRQTIATPTLMIYFTRQLFIPHYT